MTAVVTEQYSRMFHLLFLTVCISLTVTALDGKQLHKKYNFVRDDIPSACGNGRVKCQNSDRCIPQRWICDGDNDCGDLSDETNCPPVTCSDGFTKCPTANRCYPSGYHCNGVNDCGDNSDEPEDCRSRICPDGQLKCRSGQCVDFNAYCNGSESCRDGTYFTDITCPSTTCDPGYVKCAVKTKCISTSYVCDGDTDCGDFTDEPDNCRDRSCESDFFKCNNGQCLNQTALCLFISSYGCRDDTDTSSICADFTCPTGYTKCTSDGKCTANTKLCDGYSDCADGSDEAPHHCTAPLQCTQPDTAPCPGARRCINARYFCDADNDCGDNSDEDASFCSARTCQPNEVRCLTGQCIDKDSLCEGTYNCRDGSLSNKSEICAAPKQCTQPGTAPCPRARRCINARFFCDADNDCGDNSDEDASFCSTRTCQPNEVRCMTGQCIDKDSFCEGTYNCRDGSFRDRSEICSGQLQCTQPGTAPCPGARRCINARYFCDADNDCGDNSDEDASFCSTRTCQPNEVRCLTGQCIDKELFCKGTYNCRDGSLSDKSESCASEASDGSNSNSNSEMPSAEEITCISAVMSMRQCGDTPFPELAISPINERAIWNKLVETDLRDLCGPIRTWFECYQNTLSVCANVENPMLANIKQMMSIGEIVINYVCVQHLEVFNRNKACLLEKSEGENDRNIVVLKLEIPLQDCAPFAEPLNRNPACISDQLHGCVKNIVARQCGDEVTSALSDLANIIKSTAVCPAPRRRALHSSHEQRRGSFHKKA